MNDIKGIMPKNPPGKTCKRCGHTHNARSVLGNVCKDKTVRVVTITADAQPVKAKQ